MKQSQIGYECCLITLNYYFRSLIQGKFCSNIYQINFYNSLNTKLFGVVKLRYSNEVIKLWRKALIAIYCFGKSFLEVKYFVNLLTMSKITEWFLLGRITLRKLWQLNCFVLPCIVNRIPMMKTSHLRKTSSVIKNEQCRN